MAQAKLELGFPLLHILIIWTKFTFFILYNDSVKITEVVET